MAIIKAENLSVVCRLGGFHTLMRFVGSLMKGSGLEELLEEVYDPNTVIHMLTGKQIARATRGLILVYSALTTLLLETIEDQGHIEDFKVWYEKALEKQLGYAEVEEMISSDQGLLQQDRYGPSSES